MQKVEEVVAQGMCTGCGLCVADPADMQMTNSGYLRPRLIISDKISNSACPGIKIKHLNDEAPYNRLWGPILSYQTGFSTNANVRTAGSSGGVLTQLAMLLISKNKVDYIIYTGSNNEMPIRNSIFVSGTLEDIVKGAGSRYSPSAPLAVIRKLLGNGKKYAIIGKPCDISAARQLINSQPQLAEQFPYLLSFFCAGIPSENGTIEILKKLEITNPKDLKSFSYRGNGWPGLTTAKLKDDSIKTMTYNESWGTVLNRHLQSRCKICADGIGEAADLVCADAWHSSIKGYPDFEESENGRSLILARTAAGKALLSEAIEEKVIVINKYEISELTGIQQYQVNRKQTALSRMFAINLLGGSTTKFVNFELVNNLIAGGAKLNAKAFIGTFLRKLRKTL